MKMQFLKRFGAMLGAACLLGSAGCANCWNYPYFGSVGNHKRHIPKEVRAEDVTQPY